MPAPRVARSSAAHGLPRRAARISLLLTNFKFIVADTDLSASSSIYTIDTAGLLHWYTDAHRDGSANSFDAPNETAVIGNGWNTFTHVIDGGDGTLYAIDTAGKHRWYRDTHRDGTAGSSVGVSPSSAPPATNCHIEPSRR